ncbi:MAG: DUF2335 domain-containing protein [Bacteroides sp.]|nr:DUF2335 domain-containing protein [Bacteroides sp.]
MKPSAEQPEENNTLSTSSNNVSVSDISYSPPSEDGAILTRIQRTEIISGPLPHPDLLREYDKIIENAPERIMVMAEKQQDSRIEGEKEDRKAVTRGQWMGLTVIILILGLVTLFVFTGHETAAYILLGIGVATIVTAFLKTNTSKKSDKS